LLPEPAAHVGATLPRRDLRRGLPITASKGALEERRALRLHANEHAESRVSWATDVGVRMAAGFALQR